MPVVKTVAIRLFTTGAEDAKAKIDRVDKAADDLRKQFGEPLRVQIDTAAAMAKLALLNAEMRRVAMAPPAAGDPGFYDWLKRTFPTVSGYKWGPMSYGPHFAADPRFGGAGSVKGGLLARLGLGFLAGGATGAGAAGGAAGGAWWANPWAIGAGVGLLPLLAGPLGAQMGLGAFGAVAVPTITKVATAMAALTKAQAAYTAATTPAARAAALKAEQAATAGLSASQLGLMKSLQGVQTAWTNLTTALAPMVARALGPVFKLIKDLIPLMKPLAVAGGQILDAFVRPLDKLVRSGTFDEFLSVMAKAGVQFAKLFGPALANILGTLMRLFIQIAPAGTALWKALLPLVTLLVQQLAGILGKLLPPLAFAFAGVLKAITPLIKPLGDLIIAILPPLAKLIGALLVPAVKAFATIIKDGLFPALIPLAKAFNQVINALLPLIPPLTKLLVPLLPPLIKLMTGPMTDALKLLAWVLTNILVPVLKTWVGWLTNAVTWIRDKFVPWLKGAWNTVKTDAQNVWNAIVRFFQGIPGDISRALSTMFQVGKTVITNFWNGLKSLFPTILSGLLSLGQRILNALNPFHSSGSSGPGGGTPAANASLAKRMFPQLATGNQWAAWNNIAMAESGWSNTAMNASGAYGIAQALPFTKMPKPGWPPSAGGSADPATQISWMVQYMANRYGGPIPAWNFHLAHGWYDRGGFLPTGLSLALNTTGRPEPVGGACGCGITVNVYAAPLAHPADVGKAVVGAIKAYEGRNGPAWRR